MLFYEIGQKGITETLPKFNSFPTSPIKYRVPRFCPPIFFSGVVEGVWSGKGHDRYSRVLGQVSLDGKNIAMEMIAAGLATYYRLFCKDYPADKNKYNYDPQPYIAAEKEVRRLKNNIWSAERMVLVCKYRRLKD